jgi:hypothetical protein
MEVRGSACEAASCTSRSGTPASKAAVMNACRSVCGPNRLADTSTAGYPADDPRGVGIARVLTEKQARMIAAATGG